MTKFFGLRTLTALPIAGFALLALSLLMGTNPVAAQTGQKGQLHTQKVCPSSTFTGKPGSY